MMLTSRGKLIDLNNLQPGDVSVREAIDCLARVERFNGHCRHGVNVAAHSLAVSYYAWLKGWDAETQLHCLLHDLHEAYTGDITGPVEKSLGIRVVIHKLKEDVQAALYDSVALEYPTEQQKERIEQADQAVLKYELARFLPDHPAVQIDRSHYILPPSLDYYSDEAPGHAMKGRLRSLLLSLGEPGERVYKRIFEV